MKKIITLLLAVFIGQLCHGQNGQKKEIDSAVVYKVNDLTIEFSRLMRKDLDSAEGKAREILDYSKKINHHEGIGIGYGTLGSTYSVKGDVGTAIAYYIKSAKALETSGNQRLAIITNINISALLIEEREYKEALKYALKAHEAELNRAELNKNNNNIIKNLNLNSTYNLLGLIGIETKEPFEKVLNYFEKVETLSRSKNDTIKMAIGIQFQGDTYIENDKDITIAIDKLKKALKILQQYSNKNHSDVGNNYYLFSKAYLKKGLYTQALKYNDSALMHYDTLNVHKGFRKTYGLRKEILSKQEKHKEAFEASNIYIKYNDSVFKKERTNKVTRLKTEYETDQIIAQKEAAETKVQLTEAISKQNKIYTISSALIALFILMASLFYFSKLKTKKKAELITIELNETQKRLALEKQYKDSELKALKAQMNPHFIFNALNSIQDYIVLNQKNLASDYLGKFADLIRNYLHFSDTGFISILDEVHNLNLYLELEKLRFEELLDYSIHIDDDANSDSIKIPTMLIQPYVENALKHGLLHKKDNRLLNISISKISNKVIECVIQDNGVGREKSKEINKKRVSQHKSFALRATTERLDLLNDGRDTKIGVKVIDLKENDQATGTKVILKIPIITK